VERSDDLFEIQCTFNLDLYDEARVFTWMEHLRDQVLQALEDPDQPISSLPAPAYDAGSAGTREVSRGAAG
jgi:hypothetical protein